MKRNSHSLRSTLRRLDSALVDCQPIPARVMKQIRDVTKDCYHALNAGKEPECKSERSYYGEFSCGWYASTECDYCMCAEYHTPRTAQHPEYIGRVEAILAAWQYWRYYDPPVHTVLFAAGYNTRKAKEAYNAKSIHVVQLNS